MAQADRGVVTADHRDDHVEAAGAGGFRRPVAALDTAGVGIDRRQEPGLLVERRVGPEVAPIDGAVVETESPRSEQPGAVVVGAEDDGVAGEVGDRADAGLRAFIGDVPGKKMDGAQRTHAWSKDATTESMKRKFRTGRCVRTSRQKFIRRFSAL